MTEQAAPATQSSGAVFAKCNAQKCHLQTEKKRDDVKKRRDAEEEENEICVFKPKKHFLELADGRRANGVSINKR
ncbi:hypothetical protein N1851_002603 [Merluccius polli]|uniref:Uncharacterized protein n=1 Tax=Merluccius polli TaxID=89951 RepID=A0AA47NBN5_MERPO|nr:hypothetical protein N1851_002603 [Merluccius polli]